MLYLRFYEELNDFLPKGRKKTIIEVPDFGKRTVKDLIQSLGVPYTEVDLVLVNNEPVQFNYHVQSGDRIAVYPVFESLDITSVSRLKKSPLCETRFVLDVHLGKLTKYLRMLGFDTLYNNSYGDDEIVLYGQLDQRIILTRDLGLLKRKDVQRGYWLRSDQSKTQLQEIINRFDLCNAIQPMTYCMKCNSRIHAVAKEKVACHLKADTLKYFDEFYQCSGCEQVYWKGSHYDKMLELVEKVRHNDCEKQERQ